MAALPRLRRNLDLMPSPAPERPGILLRDPFQYTDAMLIVPPALAPLLAIFDGERSEADLREALFRLTGDVEVGGLTRQIVSTLSDGGFLEDEVFGALKERRRRAFAESGERPAAHAGSAYPDEAEALRQTMARYLDGEDAQPIPAPPALLGIAAPHVSPEGGHRSYRAAYRLLRPADRGRTFVLLGTSHYGEAERFGLTRKPFGTPFGAAVTDLALVEELTAAGPAAVVEDYCHAVEHSIEFQVVFLQALFGPDIRIVPVLCGPFADSTLGAGWPEDDPGVARFFEALSAMSRREGGRLLFVLGVDLAHMGRRYGDSFAARAEQGEMEEVAARDRERLARVLAGDAHGFWSLVQERQDDLKWCGASALYTFLQAVRPGQGRLALYEQWNIDEASVVSFAGLGFALPPSPGVS